MINFLNLAIMGRKRPACAISKNRNILQCPEEIWNINEQQNKIRSDDIEFINDLCSDSFEGFDNFCKVNDLLFVIYATSCIIFYAKF